MPEWAISCRSLGPNPFHTAPSRPTRCQPGVISMRITAAINHRSRPLTHVIQWLLKPSSRRCFYCMQRKRKRKRERESRSSSPLQTTDLPPASQRDLDSVSAVPTRSKTSPRLQLPLLFSQMHFNVSFYSSFFFFFFTIFCCCCRNLNIRTGTDGYCLR